MKLASIQIIKDIQPILGADNIVVASVLGWEVVVRKNEFNVGDKICYIQIDTVVPELSEYEFLRERKFRVQTIKLRKQISQGLIIPLPKGKWEEGDDITDIIGVKKYEKPDNNPGLDIRPKKPKSGYKRLIYDFNYNFLYKIFPQLLKKERSPFPTHLIPITNEERIQNIPHILDTHKGKEFYVNYKLDGSSITIIHSKFLGRNKFRICSRRFELHNKNNDWYKVFKTSNFKYEILKLVKYFNTNNIIIQGEAIGKFNGNHHNLPNEQIRLFNIFVDGEKLNQKDFIEACLKNNIPHCPLYKIIDLNYNINEILEVSNIKDPINPQVPVEGLVWRCIEDNLSFKVINNNYLLKNKK